MTTYMTATYKLKVKCDFLMIILLYLMIIEMMSGMMMSTIMRSLMNIVMMIFISYKDDIGQHDIHSLNR